MSVFIIGLVVEHDLPVDEIQYVVILLLVSEEPLLFCVPHRCGMSHLKKISSILITYLPEVFSIEQINKGKDLF